MSESLGNPNLFFNTEENMDDEVFQPTVGQERFRLISMIRPRVVIKKKKQQEMADQTNVISINLGGLSKHVQEVLEKSNIISCDHCEGNLNKLSEVVSKKEYFKKGKKVQKEKKKKKKKWKKKRKEMEKEKEKEKDQKEKNQKEKNQKDKKEKKDQKEKEIDSDLEEDEISENSLDEEDVPQDASIWTCEFCGNRKIIDNYDPQKYLPTNDRTDYLMEEKEETEKEEEEAGSFIIFCMDISGSMSVTTEVEDGKLDLKELEKITKQSFGQLEQGWGGFNEYQDYGFLYQQQRQQTQQKTKWVSRLQCLQIAVGNQIESLQREFPNTNVVLVTFNNEVEIKGNNIDASVIIKGEDLEKFERLQEIGEQYQSTQSVGKVGDKLIEKVYQLKENGQTALGPAAVIACSIAGQKPGSKVVLCTDGLSNIGIGKLEDENNVSTEEASNQFYVELADYCSNKGVVVDLITLQDTDCNIDSIGKLSNQSGGTIDIVKPAELSTRFTNIMSNPVVATNVNIEIVFHKMLYAYDDDERKVGSRLEKAVGNATKGLQLSFHYSVKEDADQMRAIKDNQIPFQIKISYTLPDGSKWLRTITNKLNIVENLKEALKDADLGLMNQNVMHRASRQTISGNITNTREILTTQTLFYNTLNTISHNNKPERLESNFQEYQEQQTLWNKFINEEEPNEENVDLFDTQDQSGIIFTDKEEEVSKIEQKREKVRKEEKEKKIEEEQMDQEKKGKEEKKEKIQEEQFGERIQEEEEQQKKKVEKKYDQKEEEEEEDDEYEVGKGNLLKKPIKKTEIPLKKLENNSKKVKKRRNDQFAQFLYQGTQYQRK
ncbi:hypothetical protein M0812_01314 [Anaeramoeba flamelloides]|uniref:Sec23/Sec24 trunk domain-containing protein n=1 Tax=Anaeramoeba flamelloides TaxID=1746091 RepID=A0AAV8A3N8_9EUKA|nr:hypothetical protein M0812_01314 [Anaeramoeba flamelloides]